MSLFINVCRVMVYHFDADGHQMLNADGSAALLAVGKFAFKSGKHLVELIFTL
jgi:hypothetical protein